MSSHQPSSSVSDNAAGSFGESKAIDCDFIVLQLAASRAQDAAVRFKTQVMETRGPPLQSQLESYLPSSEVSLPRPCSSIAGNIPHYEENFRAVGGRFEFSEPCRYDSGDMHAYPNVNLEHIGRIFPGFSTCAQLDSGLGESASETDASWQIGKRKRSPNAGQTGSKAQLESHYLRESEGLPAHQTDVGSGENPTLERNDFQDVRIRVPKSPERMYKRARHSGLENRRWMPQNSCPVDMIPKSLEEVICSGDGGRKALFAVFKSELYPTIRSACIPFQATLSKSTLRSIRRAVSLPFDERIMFAGMRSSKLICKQCANEVVNAMLRGSLRLYRYQLTRRWRSKTAITIQSLVNHKVRDMVAAHGPSDWDPSSPRPGYLTEMDSGIVMDRRSELDTANREHSPGLIRDISLLGAGQTSLHTTRGSISDPSSQTKLTIGEVARKVVHCDKEESTYISPYAEPQITAEHFSLSSNARQNVSGLKISCLSISTSSQVRDAQILGPATSLRAGPTFQSQTGSSLVSIPTLDARHHECKKSIQIQSRPAPEQHSSGNEARDYEEGSQNAIPAVSTFRDTVTGKGGEVANILGQDGPFSSPDESSICERKTLIAPAAKVQAVVPGLETTSFPSSFATSPQGNVSSRAFQSVATTSFDTINCAPEQRVDSAKLPSTTAIVRESLSRSRKPSFVPNNMPRRLVRHPKYVLPTSKASSPEPSISTPPVKPPIRGIIRRPAGRHSRKMPSLLRHRELGGRDFNGSSLIHRHIHHHISAELTYWRTWTGASKDVVAAAWAPNGITFAVGAATDLDNQNLQYNRRNNFLLGDLASNTLTELPDHFVDRPRPETIDHGENARPSTYNSVDPELYTTVSSIDFSISGDIMFSASYDKTVKIWDISKRGQHACVKTLGHDTEVDLLASTKHHPNVLATGQKSTDESIRVYQLDCLYSATQNDRSVTFNTLSSHRARKYGLFPQSLQWGTAPEAANLLLAGFSEVKDDFSLLSEGELCLWDAETATPLKLAPCSQSIFDAIWHPSEAIIAAASTRGPRGDLTNRYLTRSVIRTYKPFEMPNRIMEYECPALDINDVRFNPVDDNYISVGCTDGVTYVWDFRMPDQILHQLRHDRPIDEMAQLRSREEQDTGVRFTLWDQEGLRFYTGSSDGSVKCWDILRSSEDAFVREVARFDSGIMCGVFSPDYTNLLVGLSNGAVHVLSCAPWSHLPNSTRSDSDLLEAPFEKFTYVPAKQEIPAEDEIIGIESANELLSSGQLKMHRIFGAGKGPAYKGPYASYARPESTDPSVEPLFPDILAKQLHPSQRKLGRKLGGRATDAETETYRREARVANERNSLAFRLRGGRKEEIGRQGGDPSEVKKEQVEEHELGEEKMKQNGKAKASASKMDVSGKAKLGTQTMPIVIDEDGDEYDASGGHGTEKGTSRAKAKAKTFIATVDDDGDNDGGDENPRKVKSEMDVPMESHMEMNAGENNKSKIKKRNKGKQAVRRSEEWKGDWKGYDTEELMEEDYWFPEPL
ncbi:hypothetical protein MMC24_002197 [Lignoscripta atroalba]|nr:hypothetical protein [Lignoscripta atroalba]